MQPGRCPFCIPKAIGATVVSFLQRAACLAALCNERKQRLHVVTVTATIDTLGGSLQLF